MQICFPVGAPRSGAEGVALGRVGSHQQPAAALAADARAYSGQLKHIHPVYRGHHAQVERVVACVGAAQHRASESHGSAVAGQREVGDIDAGHVLCESYIDRARVAVARRGHCRERTRQHVGIHGKGPRGIIGDACKSIPAASTKQVLSMRNRVLLGRESGVGDGYDVVGNRYISRVTSIV